MKQIRTNIRLLVAAFVIVLLAVGVAKAGVVNLSVEETHNLLNQPPAGLVILDVRTPAEYADGHLAGAVLVDFSSSDFFERIDVFERKAPYLVYCRTGRRSAEAIKRMTEMGFSTIYHMEEGFRAWQTAGKPTVR